MENKVSILYIGGSSEVISQLGANDQIVLTALGNLQAADIYLSNGHLPDAILCEQFISGGTGIEFHYKLRKNTAFSGVAFILLTHEFREDLFKSAFKNRIDDFYVLPLPPIENIISRVQFLRDSHRKYPISGPVFIPDDKFKMPRSKRIFDLVVACTALLLLSPILLIVISAISIESKGKVYYASKRVGRKPFDFYKLRSMRTGSDVELEKLAKEQNQYAAAPKKPAVDFSLPCPRCASLPAGEKCSWMIMIEGNHICEYWYTQQTTPVPVKSKIDFTIPCPRCANLPQGEKCSPVMHIQGYEICEYWYLEQKHEIAKTKSVFNKIPNDPRVTKVGKFIRKTSIDELPQLINVIKNDMSIVGNRPLPGYEAELLTMGEMAKRFQAPAGITGLWQVELRGKRGVMTDDERKSYDNEYADHFAGDKYRFSYDLWLILRTVPALFQKEAV